MATNDVLEVSGRILDAKTGKPPRWASMIAFSLHFEPERGLDEHVPDEFCYVDQGLGDDARFTQRLPRALGKHRLRSVAIVAWSPEREAFVRVFTVAQLEKLGPLEILLEEGPYWAHTVGVRAEGTDRLLPGVGVRLQFGWMAEAGSLRKSPGPKTKPLLVGRGPRPTLCLDYPTGEDGLLRTGGPGSSSPHVRLNGPGFFGPKYPRHATSPEGPLLEVPGTRILIEAQDDRGAPAPDAIVWHFSPQGWSHRLELDGDGKCRGVGFVGAHQFTLRLARPDLNLEPWKRAVSDVEEVVELRRGDEKVLVLRPKKPTARLECHVRTTTGKPAAAVPLWLGQPEGRFLVRNAFSVRTDDDGVARFGVLMPGQYKLADRELLHGDVRDARVVELRPKTRRVVRLRTPERFPLLGVVRTSSGKPAFWASVVATDATNLSRRGRTDAKGRFELDPLQPGPVKVRVDDAHGPEREVLETTIDHDGREVALSLERRSSSLVIRGSISPDQTSAVTRVVAHISPASRKHAEHAKSFGFGEGPVEEGRFSIEVLEFGLVDVETQLTLHVHDFLPIRRKLPGGVREHDLGELNLEEGVSIRGSFEDLDDSIARGGHANASAYVRGLGIVRDAALLGTTFELRGLPRRVVEITVTLSPPHTTRENTYFTGKVKVNPAKVPGGDLGRIELQPRRHTLS